jgi:hypothetical protein
MGIYFLQIHLCLKVKGFWVALEDDLQILV